MRRPTTVNMALDPDRLLLSSTKKSGIIRYNFFYLIFKGIIHVSSTSAQKFNLSRFSIFINSFNISNINLVSSCLCNVMILSLDCTLRFLIVECVSA